MTYIRPHHSPAAAGGAYRCPTVQSIYDPKDSAGFLRRELDLAAAEIVPRSQRWRVRPIADDEVVIACQGVRPAVWRFLPVLFEITIELSEGVCWVWRVHGLMVSELFFCYKTVSMFVSMRGSFALNQGAP